jgi:hypothetical protein
MAISKMLMSPGGECEGKEAGMDRMNRINRINKFQKDGSVWGS